MFGDAGVTDLDFCRTTWYELAYEQAEAQLRVTLKLTSRASRDWAGDPQEWVPREATSGHSECCREQSSAGGVEPCDAEELS